MLLADTYRFLCLLAFLVLFDDFTFVREQIYLTTPQTS